MSTPQEAELISGKAIAAEIQEEIKEMASELKEKHNIVPGLAVVLVGSRSDSATYVRMKKKAAAALGYHSVDVTLPEDATQDQVMEAVEKLNNDDAVHGILVQLPLPKHINEHTVLKAIKISKDVDGFSAENIGNLCLKGGEPPLAIPCTPAGVVEMLQRSNVVVQGKHAVVLGRSNIVGMPVAQLLISMNATVTVCHSGTKDLPSFLKQADIVVVAIGKPEFVRGEWLKPGCVVIDVGINSKDDVTRKAGYRLVGDVNFDEAKAVASKITPVPGGVGPMTIAMLMKNTLMLSRNMAGLPRLPLRSNRKSVPNC